MVIVGLLIDEEDTQKLVNIGVKDSKLLSPSARISLFSRIIRIAKDHKILIIQPSEIDEAVNSDSSNLNWLEAQKAATIANLLKPDKVIIDCPSNNKLAFKRFLEAAISRKPELVVEHKADAKYPVVSAASVIAKVTRDAEIEKIKRKLKVDFGSGYPSDPRTKEFLEKNFMNYPGIFRKSWATHKRLLKKENQKTLEDFRGDR